MPSISDRLRFKVSHNLSVEKAGFNLSRHTNRETTHIAQRPVSGHADVEVECGHCGRTERYRILDRERTGRLRRTSALRWGAGAVILAVFEAIMIATGAAGAFIGALLVFLGGVGLLVSVVAALVGPRDLHGATRINGDGTPWKPTGVHEPAKGGGSYCMVTVEAAD